MTKVTVDISMSLDGYVAGPDAPREPPLGVGGMLLRVGVLGFRGWRKRDGMEGGEENADSDLVDATTEAVGATIMGRRMFSSGSGPWAHQPNADGRGGGRGADDPNANGWWGDEPPFENPVFILTHHPRERMEFANGTSFTFVTD